MSDPRFFRKYLDILAEQPATLNIDDNTSVTADPTAKTISAQTKVGDNLNLQATHDRSAVPSNQIKADLQVDPNLNVGATYTQQGYKGQMTPTSQIRASYDVPDTDIKLDARYDKGAMFQGAGKNIKPGDSSITTMTASNPQGKSITYSTNRNL